MTSLEIFLKDFKVIGPYKETGQKQVFLSEHSNFGEVVIKIGKSPSKVRLDRARREVEIQKSLDSSYYPKIYDFRIFENFQFVIIEEFIDSQPLSECHERFSDPLSILQLLKSLVHGLDLLWQVRVAHRDLKPDNILIKADSSPVIIDLGIVLAIGRTDLTPLFALRSPCTPAYAAPEQLINRRAEIDHRTDQFILGIDIMELIVGGAHPFDPAQVGRGRSIEENIASGNWVKDKLDSDKFLSLKKLVLKLLAPEPYMRYRKTDSLKVDIERCWEDCK